MILLYANPIEVKYIDYEDKFCIGVGANIKENFAVHIYGGLVLPHAYSDGELGFKDDVILFGSSGLIAPPRIIDYDYSIFLEPKIWYNEDGECIEMEHGLYKGITTELPVKSRLYTNILRSNAYLCCDMESYHVAKICKEAGVKFRSIRYVIDRCNEKVMPTGINWAWRKYQHKRMQQKFSKLLSEGYYE